jgi:hypothetical protein
VSVPLILLKNVPYATAAGTNRSAQIDGSDAPGEERPADLDAGLVICAFVASDGCSRLDPTPTTCHQPQYGQRLTRTGLCARKAIASASTLDSMAGRLVGHFTPRTPRTISERANSTPGSRGWRSHADGDSLRPSHLIRPACGRRPRRLDVLSCQPCHGAGDVSATPRQSRLRRGVLRPLGPVPPSQTRSTEGIGVPPLGRSSGNRNSS